MRLVTFEMQPSKLSSVASETFVYLNSDDSSHRALGTASAHPPHITPSTMHPAEGHPCIVSQLGSGHGGCVASQQFFHPMPCEKTQICCHSIRPDWQTLARGLNGR